MHDDPVRDMDMVGVPLPITLGPRNITPLHFTALFCVAASTHVPVVDLAVHSSSHTNRKQYLYLWSGPTVPPPIRHECSNHSTSV
jgi:hypothetical protein